MISPPTDSAEKARRKQILDAFDAALDLPEAERLTAVRTRHADDPRLVAAVEALLAADALAPSAMPTELDLGGEATTIVPPRRIGAYALIERLGGGGMGEVWLGRRDDGLFEHEVAIKLMRPSRLAGEALAFFDTERRALARMRHRHIARLFDGGVTPEGLPWMIMELVEGCTLDQWLLTRHPSQAEIVRVMTAVAEAVQYAHQQLVVHADLKPSNILVDDKGEPSLVDFGISSLAVPEKAADDGRVRPRTPAYASPERLAGQPPAPADDIYALGLLLRGLLTGHWPEETVTGVLSGDLAATVARAVATDPKDRYATAQAFADDLKAHATHRPVSARAGGRAYHARLFVRRHPMAVSAAAAAVVAMAVALVVISLLYARAETRFTEVRQLAGFMLGEQYDALERLPGTAALRARTADVGRDYLERLSRVPGAPDDLRFDVAVGYGRVGHALATTSTNTTGDTARGEKALAASEAGLRELLRRHAGRDDIRKELARTLTWKSGVLSGARNDYTDAYAALDEADVLYGIVLDHRPGNVDAAYGRWNAAIARADVLIADSRNAEAARISEAALDSGLRLSGTGPYASLKPLMTAASENAIGDAIYDRSPGDAIARYASAAATLEAARAGGVRDVRILIRLASYDYQVASSYQDTGKPDLALAWADKGAGLMEELMRYDDSAATLHMAVLLDLTRAEILSGLGRTGEAMPAAQKAVAIKRQLARAQPDDTDTQFGLASALRLYAQNLDAWKQPAAACTALREAKTIWARYTNLPQRLRDNEVAVIDARLKTCR